MHYWAALGNHAVFHEIMIKVGVKLPGREQSLGKV